MRDRFYILVLPDGCLTGLTTPEDAKAKAKHYGGTVAVSDSEFYNQKGREYTGPYPTVSEVQNAVR